MVELSAGLLAEHLAKILCDKHLTMRPALPIMRCTLPGSRANRTARFPPVKAGIVSGVIWTRGDSSTLSFNGSTGNSVGEALKRVDSCSK